MYKCFISVISVLYHVVKCCCRCLIAQRVGAAQSGVQTFRSFGSGLTQQRQRARVHGGWRTCTSCTSSSCGHSTRWLHISNEHLSTCTPETHRRTVPPRTCYWKFSMRSSKKRLFVCLCSKTFICWFAKPLRKTDLLVQTDTSQQLLDWFPWNLK